MQTLGNWILGAIMVVIALVGLFMAAKAADTVFQFGGFLFFLFGVGYCLALIAKSTGNTAHDDAPPQEG
jgi:hypothetical protein